MAISSKKKRHKRGASPEERLAVEACRQLHRSAKVARTFIVRKQIRKLKKAVSTEDEANSMGRLKKLPLRGLLRRGLTWLGLSLDVLDKLESEGKVEEKTEDEEYVEVLMKHPKVKACLHKLAEKRRELRRRQFAKEQGIQYVPLKKKEETKQIEDVAGTSAVFVDSLAGELATDEHGATADIYGPGDDRQKKKMKKKRNRPGQRQRRKEFQDFNGEGQAPHSRNRARGPDRGPGRAKHGDANAELKASQKPKRRSDSAVRKRELDEATEGRDSTSEGPSKKSKRVSQNANGAAAELHPSWVARQMQKKKGSNIAAFQGKKITFD